MPKHQQPFGAVIAEHWRQNFPKEAAELEQAGQLESAADRAAEKSANVMEQCLAKGMEYHQAHELGTQEWGTPPSPTSTTSHPDPAT